MLWGSLCAKSACKTLVKLTPEEVGEVDADDDDLEDVAGVAVFLVTDLQNSDSVSGLNFFLNIFDVRYFEFNFVLK